MTKFSSLLLFLFITQLANSQQSLFRITEKGKTGYINSSGATVIPPIYINGFDFRDGLAAVRENGSYGFIDSSGKYVIPPQFDYATYFVNGITLVYKQRKSYFIDKTGKVALPGVYQSMKFIDNRKAIITTRSKRVGIIDVPTRRLLLDTVYNDIKDFKNGLSVVIKYNPKAKQPWSKTIIDTACKFIGPLNNPETSGEMADIDDNITFRYHEGIARFIKRISWQESYPGLVGINGDTILNDPVYKYIDNFSCGRTIAVDTNDNYFVLDRNGKRVGTQSFEYIKNFDQNHAVIKTGKGYGIIDTNAHTIIPPKYNALNIPQGADYFFFTASDSEGYGMANMNNEVIIQPIMTLWDDDKFENDLLNATINGRSTWINKQGKIIWQQSEAESQAIIPMQDEHIGYSFYRVTSPEEEQQAAQYDYHDRSKISYKRVTPADHFTPNKFIFRIDSTYADTLNGRYIACKLIVGNTQKDTIKLLNIFGLAIKLQALDEDGIWKDIEVINYPSHTNGYSITLLNPGTYYPLKIPRFAGSFTTKLRAALWYLDKNNKVQSIRSNAINASIDKTQFWREYNYPEGVYDPILNSRNVNMSTIKKNNYNQFRL